VRTLELRLLLIASTLLLLACGRPGGGGDAAVLWNSTVFDLADRPVALAGYRGRPLVINFWARWCPPCRDEIPDFVRARAHFNGQDVELLGIAIEDQAEPVRKFAAAHRINYPVLLARDQGLPLMAALGNDQGALPFTVVIDREGNIVGRKVGRMSLTEIDAAFTAAIR